MPLFPNYRDFIDGVILNPAQSANEPPNTRIQDEPIPVVYGLQRISPPIMWYRLSDFDSQSLIVTYALSEGPCFGIYRLFIEDLYVRTTQTMALVESPSFGIGTANTVTEPVDGAFAGIVEFEFMSGREYALGLNSKLLTAHIANPQDRPVYEDELCYLVVRYIWTNDETSPYRDIPKLTVDLFGKQVADTFPGDTVRKYSTNPAKHIWDYMTNTRYGAGFDSSVLDTTSFQAGVTYYDSNTDVTLTNGQLLVTKRVTSNIVVNTSNSVRSNLDNMLFVNSAYIPFIDGKFIFDIEKQDSPEIDFTEDAIIGEVNVLYPDTGSKYNSVYYSFLDAEKDFIKVRKRYPVSDADVAALLTEDNGHVNIANLEFDSVTDPYMAERIARQYLEKSRKQIKINFKTFKDGWKYKVGDVARIKTLVPDLDYVEIRIISIAFNEDNTLDIEAYSHDDTFYPTFTDFFQIPEDYKKPLIPTHGGVLLPSNPTTPISVIPPAPGDGNPGPGDTGNPGQPNTAPIMPVQPGEDLPPKPQGPVYKYTTSNVSGGGSLPTIGPNLEYFVGKIANGTGSLPYEVDSDYVGGGDYARLTFEYQSASSFFYKLMPAITHRNGNSDPVGYVYEVDDQGNYGWVMGKTIYKWDPQNPTTTVTFVDGTRSWDTRYAGTINFNRTLFPRLNNLQSNNDPTGLHVARQGDLAITWAPKGNPYPNPFQRAYTTYNANWRHFDNSLYGPNSGITLQINVKFFNYINSSTRGFSPTFTRFIGSHSYTISNAQMTQAAIEDSRKNHNSATGFSDLPF